jgi:hypothetical protein
VIPGERDGEAGRPRGHAAAFGLDMIKAEYSCDTAAARFGGIVAPSQTYHIHETGSTPKTTSTGAAGRCHGVNGVTGL